MLWNKTDIEILWTLKNTSSSVPQLDLLNNHPNTSEFKKRLRYLVEDDLIGCSLIQNIGPCYWIKKKGENLIWSGTTREKILKLLQIFECTQDDFHHFINEDSIDNIQSELKSLKMSAPRIIDSIIKNDGKKYYRLTIIGENLLKERNSSLTTNITTQYNIGVVNIQNFQTYIEKLKSEIEQEPELNSKQKTELQDILNEEKNIWKKLEDKSVELGGKFTGHTIRAFLGLD